MRQFRIVLLAIGVSLTGCLPKKSSQKKAPAAESPEPDPGSDDGILSGGKPVKLESAAANAYAEREACVLLNVDILDAEELLTSADKDTRINLSVEDGSLGFFQDPACTTAVKNLTIPKNEGSGGVYFKAPANGLAKVTFSDAAPDGLAAAKAVVHVATVSQLEFRVTGAVQNTNECYPYAVSALDAEGHPVTLAKETALTATSTASTGKFYSDFECSTPSANAKIAAGFADFDEVFYKDTVAGTPTITIAALGKPSWKKATAAITVSNETPETP